MSYKIRFYQPTHLAPGLLFLPLLWDFSGKGGKNLAWSLEILGEVLNKNTFCCDFVAILYQNAAILKNFLPREIFCVRNFVSQGEISRPWKKYPVTERNFLLPEEISCHKKEYHRKKLPVTGRNFTWQEISSCDRKKFHMTGQSFKSQSHRKKFPVTGRNSLLMEEISCHREKISCHRKKFSVTGRHFLSQENHCCNGKKFHPKKQNF